ncbi:MAG: AzlC family ABC transporter permease [Lachnospiraceae bacterium]|nr:AzlC family ABC transporter permease [Lachnospiraceae bacterium]MEE0919123.1 AzlC family ABC transporter permease [Lachnospiraceae bacterium]
MNRNRENKSEFLSGLKDGIPIALGYLSVSFSLGIMVLKCGLSIFQGALMSATNVTSAGQFAGLGIIAAGGALIEIVITQFIINLRYALMSLSLSQKLDDSVKLWQRFVIAFANTDEIFAVAMSHQKNVTFKYMLGLQSLPIAGWVAGTVLGGVACELMPDSVSRAMSVALYGMFIAIVVPVVKKERSVLFVVCMAVALSCAFYYVPAFKQISSGVSIIISTVVASAVGAVVFPVKESDEDALKMKDENAKDKVFN